VITVGINFVVGCVAVFLIVSGFSLAIIQKKGYRVKPLGVGSIFLIGMSVIMGTGGISRLASGVYPVFVVAIVLGLLLTKPGFEKKTA